MGFCWFEILETVFHVSQAIMQPTFFSRMTRNICPLLLDLPVAGIIHKLMSWHNRGLIHNSWAGLEKETLIWTFNTRTRGSHLVGTSVKNACISFLPSTWRQCCPVSWGWAHISFSGIKMTLNSWHAWLVGSVSLPNYRSSGMQSPKWRSWDVNPISAEPPWVASVWVASHASPVF